MKCPKCAADVVDGAADCPSCGIFFEKWRRLQERKKEEALVQEKVLEVPPVPARVVNPWTVRIVSAVFAGLWIIGLAWVIQRDVRRIRAAHVPTVGSPTPGVFGGAPNAGSQPPSSAQSAPPPPPPIVQPTGSPGKPPLPVMPPQLPQIPPELMQGGVPPPAQP